MRKTLVLLTLCAAISLATAQDMTRRRIYQTKELGHSAIKVGTRTIPVWLADSETKREEGMMWLQAKDVPNGKGMLFIFADEADRGFWMQNTLIPLDIAYITAAGKVANVVLGKPLDQTTLRSTAPSKYVLELKAGDAKRLGVKAGVHIAIPKELRSKD